jgi:hypothetical protein
MPVTIPRFALYLKAGMISCRGLTINTEIVMARPPGTWLFAEMFFNSDQGEWSTEFWFDGAAHAKPAAFDINALAISVQAAYAASFEAIMYTGVNCLGTMVEANFGAGTFGGETHDNFSGSNTNLPIPLDVAAVVRKATQTGGRSGSGRWRIGGLCVDSIAGSYLSPAGVTFFLSLASNLIAPITDQGVTWTPQVYSRKTNTLIAITSSVTDLLLGTQRRRRARF